MPPSGNGRLAFRQVGALPYDGLPVRRLATKTWPVTPVRNFAIRDAPDCVQHDRFAVVVEGFERGSFFTDEGRKNLP
jgi:hypothetical protein